MKVAMEVVMVRSQMPRALGKPDGQKGQYMKSAMLLSQTEALEEEVNATEQERDGLEVDCGKQPLALNFPTLFQVLEMSNISTLFHAFWHMVSYTILVPNSHSTAAQGSRES